MGSRVVLFSRDGHDFTDRLLCLDRSAASRDPGQSSYPRRRGRGQRPPIRHKIDISAGAELHIWAFDLLALNGKDLRKWSLEGRQGRLRALVSRFGA
jgi:ATP-dependent DNA ligase